MYIISNILSLSANSHIHMVLHNHAEQSFFLKKIILEISLDLSEVSGRANIFAGGLLL